MEHNASCVPRVEDQKTDFMINNILIKCLQELENPEVNIAYVRGMLETLIEMNNPTIEQASKAIAVTKQPGKPKDEGDALDARARAALKTVQELSAQAESP